jgi:hypothetical protein
VDAHDHARIASGADRAAHPKSRRSSKVTIETLAAVVPPPVASFESFRDGAWDVIEAELGTPLPQDYKDFVRLYGCGEFMEFLTIHVPRSRSRYVRLEAEAHAVTKLAGELVDDGRPFPYPFWPTPGGLLACGKTGNGDSLFWLTRGSPDDWTIVVWGRGSEEFEAFDCDLTGFLAGVATGEIKPDDFPEDMLLCDSFFTPYSAKRRGVYSVSWRVTYGGAPNKESS